MLKGGLVLIWELDMNLVPTLVIIGQTYTIYVVLMYSCKVSILPVF